MNIAIWLQRAAILHPEAPALFRGTQQIANYAQFWARSQALSDLFIDSYGIKPGDRIALFHKNTPDYLTVLYAAWICGAVPVPINGKLHPRETAYIVDNSQALIVLTSQSDCANLQDLCANSKVVALDQTVEEALKRLDDTGQYQQEPNRGIVHRGYDDMAWLFYTSGTTGNPKGVMMSHGNLHAMAFSYFVDVDNHRQEDSMIYAAPISHGAGIYNFIAVMRAGRHIVPESGGFDCAEIFALAKEHRNLCFFAAPTMIKRLIAHAKDCGENGDGFKTIVYGGGPMYLSDIVEAVDCLGDVFAQIYGQGECPMAITVLQREDIQERKRPGWEDRLASVGFAQSCVEVKVADSKGNSLPAGEIGEIMVRGSPVMLGYWRNQEATDKTIVDDWLITGDIGCMDEQGYLTLKDRSKDVIISGGTNIYPREVEEVLLCHEGVAEVAVIGRNNPEWGEDVVAFVVLSENAKADIEELDRHCLDNIARFKRPKLYHFLDSLPKNNYGKVLKTELRKIDKAHEENASG